MPTLGPSVSGESASPADAVAGAAPAPAAPATASAGPTGRPHRRLALTAPTDGRRQMDATGAAVGPAVETVMGTYRLPKVLVEALEEEWWRRQAAGEAWSRSEIVAASVANGLADPARLDEALRHLHERKIS
ncbi:MAG: hypothetical protein HY321_19455 [Armatimonadetes bacterium]|nr:hypothetical protein [Armatimonadota bacterium]